MTDILGHGMKLDSALLQALAQQAARRCGPGVAEFEALGAIVLTYSAMEAFVNEVAGVAADSEHRRSTNMDSQAQEVIARLSLALEVAASQRASLEFRYDLAWRVLAGSPPEKGAGTRQSLSTLAKVRNAIVHLEPQATDFYVDALQSDGSESTSVGQSVDSGGAAFRGVIRERHAAPPFMRALASAGLVKEGDTSARWLHRISNPKVANWACSITESSSKELLDLLPQCSVRERLAAQSLGGCIERR